MAQSEVDRTVRVDAPPLVPGGAAAFLRERAGFLRAAVSLLAVIAVWEYLGQTIWKHSFAVAAPSAIVKDAYELTVTGKLVPNVVASAQEFALGFLIAAAAGILIGILMAASQALHDFVDPWISIVYSMPTIALAPIFILWLGIGISSKVAVVCLLAIFPIIINTEVGIRSADRHLVEVARSFKARRWQIFTKVLVPAALPMIVSGLRLGVGRGLVGIVVGEIFGARAGLGYMILLSSQLFDPATLFVAIIILGIVGMLAVVLLQRIERRMAPWRHVQSR